MDTTLLRQIDPRKLRAARVAAGLTQAQLAECVNVSKAQVGNIETGFSSIHVDMLPRWAEVCGIADLDTLYTEAAPGAFATRKKPAA